MSVSLSLSPCVRCGSTVPIHSRFVPNHIWPEEKRVVFSEFVCNCLMISLLSFLYVQINRRLLKWSSPIYVTRDSLFSVLSPYARLASSSRSGDMPTKSGPRTSKESVSLSIHTFYASHAILISHFRVIVSYSPVARWALWSIWIQI